MYEAIKNLRDLISQHDRTVDAIKQLEKVLKKDPNSYVLYAENGDKDKESLGVAYFGVPVIKEHAIQAIELSLEYYKNEREYLESKILKYESTEES